MQSAAPFLYKASSMATNDLDLRLKLAYVYISFAYTKEAREAAKFILTHDPKSDEAPLILAAASLTDKDSDETRVLLETLAKNGDRAAYEVALGILATHRQDIKTAGDHFKRALELDPKSPPALEAMGNYYALQNDLPKAEASLKQASDLSNARSARRMVYARFKLQTGKVDEARQILDDAVKQAPDYVPALMGLAQIALSEKKYDDARNYANQVLARDPDDFDAMLFQSQLAMAQNQPDQAVAGLERMSKLHPQAPGVQSELGMAYMAAGTKQRPSFASIARWNWTPISRKPS